VLNVTIPTLAMRGGDFSAENKIYDPLTTRPSPAPRSRSAIRSRQQDSANRFDR